MNLAELEVLGIRARVDGEQLVLSPRDRLTPELVEQIRAAKPGLVAELRQQPPVASGTAVVRLRLLLEAEDGRRLEAILVIPRARYDGLRVLELFEEHRMAGTTRVVGVSEAA